MFGIWIQSSQNDWIWHIWNELIGNLLQACMVNMDGWEVHSFSHIEIVKGNFYEGLHCDGLGNKSLQNVLKGSYY